jgi:hypothetical protein
MEGCASSRSGQRESGEWTVKGGACSNLAIGGRGMRELQGSGSGVQKHQLWGAGAGSGNHWEGNVGAAGGPGDMHERQWRGRGDWERCLGSAGCVLGSKGV